MAIAAVGWEACKVEWWLDIADQLQQSGLPWSDGAALMDLRFWEGQIRLGRARRIPSRRRLMARWSWSDHRVRCLLRSEEWLDGHFHASQVAPNNPPEIPQESPKKETKRQEETKSISQQSPNNHPTISNSTPHARSTQAQTQTTDTLPACGLAGTELQSVSGDGRNRIWPELVRDLQKAGYTTLEEISSAGRDAIAADLGRSASKTRLDKIWRVLTAHQIESSRPASQSDICKPKSGNVLSLEERYSVEAPAHQPGHAPWDLADYSGDRTNGK